MKNVLSWCGLATILILASAQVIGDSRKPVPDRVIGDTGRPAAQLRHGAPGVNSPGPEVTNGAQRSDVLGQFEIQSGTSELQGAKTNKSSVEKKAKQKCPPFCP